MNKYAPPALKKRLTHSLAAIDLSTQYGFGGFKSVSSVLSTMLPRAFQVAAVAVFFYLLIGALKFILSGGDKEKVSSGRQMITHALIGLVMLVILFTMLKFIFNLFGLKDFNIV